MKDKLVGCLKTIFYIFILVMIVPGFIIGIASSFEDDEDELETTARADGFTIEEYKVVLNVQEDNKVDVTEYLTVNWNEDYHHGIYRFIPQWLEYTGQDGNTIKRKSKISNLSTKNDEYTLSYVKKKAKIQIGSADKYVSLGDKLYTISYTYDMGTDPFKGFDEFIFHAYGDYWGTEIKNASIEVHMPKSIDGYNINFFTDKYRGNNVTEYVDYTIRNNTLYASFNSDKYKQAQYDEYCSNTYHLNEDGTCNDYSFDYSYKPLKKSLTVDIELPENYFKKGSWNYGWWSFILICLIIISTIFTIKRWLKFGKDYPKRTKTVEFYPPDNLSAAEIGYIYKKQPSKKLTIALMIQLASKGYIKIDETCDKKKEIKITNLYRKPKKVSPLKDNTPKRTIEIKKLKDLDNDLSSSASTMMKHLFKDGDIKYLDANIDKFLEVKDELIKGNYIEILNDNDKSNMEALELQKREYDKDLEKYNEAISKLKPLSSFENIVYKRLFEKEDVIIVSEHKTLYMAFNEIDNDLNNKTYKRINDVESNNKFAFSIFMVIVISILQIIAYYVTEDMSPNWSILYKISFICIFISLFFTIFMKRKTKYGEEIKARVAGFRDFLITVEKPKLEELVSENPEYFYDILPYTYVLNISKTWIRKFENIPIPEKNMGSFNYSSDYAYNSIYNDVHYPAPTNSTSSSSSSCGGGCSSCGGGCSSCGGGGSW
jgi:uncharacterized membrane protein YgcG